MVYSVNGKVGVGTCVKLCGTPGEACGGATSSEADAKCCSGRCHVTSVDFRGGGLAGYCDTECQPDGASCTGATWQEADNRCCSGLCDVTIVNGKVGIGRCVKCIYTDGCFVGTAEERAKAVAETKPSDEVEKRTELELVQDVGAQAPPSKLP